MSSDINPVGISNYNDRLQLVSLRHYQSGFTLLELMIAMAIFAMLAVAGWQVFDSISRSKERAELQTDVLTELQYGYQQIQRDMSQVVAYQLPNTTDSNSAANSLLNNGLNSGSNESSAINVNNSFKLQSNQLSFIRYADPDPRYLQSTNLERIVYTFNDGLLIRQRFATLNANSNERPLTSVIVKGANEGSWQVLLPEPANIYPNPDVNNNISNNNQAHSLQSVPSLANQTASGSEGQTSNQVELPRGVSVSFTVTLGSVNTPITWVYALKQVPPNATSHKYMPPEPES